MSAIAPPKVREGWHSSLGVGERHSNPFRVEGVESWTIVRVILDEKLATRLYHDALGDELEDGTAPVKRARFPLVGGILELENLVKTGGFPCSG